MPLPSFFLSLSIIDPAGYFEPDRLIKLIFQLWTRFMCVARWWTVNHLSHWGHWLRSFWWIATWWFFSSADVLKLFSQSSSAHMWGLSLSVCLFFMWLSNHLTFLPQIGQVLALPCTIFSCCSRWARLLKVFWQKEQVRFFTVLSSGQQINLCW